MKYQLGGISKGLVAVAVIMLSMGAAQAGPIILSGMDPEDHDTGGGTQGTDMISDVLEYVVENATNNGAAGTGSNILMFGPSGGIGADSINASTIATGLGYTMTVVSSVVDIAAQSLAGFDAIYMPTSDSDVSGGLTDAQVHAINARSADIVSFVNAGGGLAAFAQNVDHGYGWFPLGGLLTTNLGSGGISGIELTALGSTILSPSATAVEPFHTTFDGPAGFFGLSVLADETATTNRALIIGGGQGTVITPNPLPEPATVLLFAAGLLGLAGFARRRKNSVKSEMVC